MNTSEIVSVVDVFPKLETPSASYKEAIQLIKEMKYSLEYIAQIKPELVGSAARNDQTQRANEFLKRWNLLADFPQ